jgi:sn-glycerol 3-phosphate transport system substrate-binding protein
VGLVAGLLALGLLACDPSPQTEAGRAPITATFWYSYGGRNREVLEELIAQFHAVQSRYRIEAHFQGSYFEAVAKLRAALVVHEGPTFAHVVSEVLPYLWDAGVLEDLDPWAAREDGFDVADLVFPLSQHGAFDYGGRRVPLFALPFNRSTPIAYYNRDVFAAAGLSPPTTWQELRAVAEQLTVRSDGQTERWGFEVPIDWWFWMGLLYQAGGRLLTADGAAAELDSQAGEEALNLWVDMVADGHMRPPPGRDYNAWEVTNSDFIQGRAAMIWTSTAFLAYLTENAPFPVGVAPLPGGARRAVPTGGTFFVMLRDADEGAKEAAWACLSFMMEPEQTAYWSRRTGYLPVNRRALDLPEMRALYEADPNYRVAYDQLEVAVPFPFSPSLYTLEREHLQPALEGPVLRLETAAEALRGADEAAETTLQRYRTACVEEGP